MQPNVTMPLAWRYVLICGAVLTACFRAVAISLGDTIPPGLGDGLVELYGMGAGMLIAYYHAPPDVLGWLSPATKDLLAKVGMGSMLIGKIAVPSALVLVHHHQGIAVQAGMALVAAGGVLSAWFHRPSPTAVILPSVGV